MKQKQERPQTYQPSPQTHEEIYEIIIKGLLDDHWLKWFDGMTVKRWESRDAEQGYTQITGPIPDQPALHGILAKIRDLNLILVSVKKLPTPYEDKSE